MSDERRIYVAGHRGLVGSAITKVFGDDPRNEFVHPTDRRVDLCDRAATVEAIREARPDVVILVAARVGGLGANIADPVGFFTDNLQLELNTLHAAHEAGVPRLLFVSSANAYPVDAPQPIDESSLGTGAIDLDTEAYGMSKLLGIRLCDAYRRQYGVTYHSIVPSNLYGPHDRFDPKTAHVVAATLRRFEAAVLEDARTVTVWGTGRQRRQMLYSEDLARACALLLDLEDPPSWINAGPIGDVTIAEIAETAARIVGYDGDIEYDATRPEGVTRRELDSSRLHALGWSCELDLEAGMRRTWDWFQSTQSSTTATTETTLT